MPQLQGALRIIKFYENISRTNFKPVSLTEKKVNSQEHSGPEQAIAKINGLIISIRDWAFISETKNT